METTLKWLTAMVRGVLKEQTIDVTHEDEIDWEMLYSFSNIHKISGLTAYALKDFQTVPEEIREIVRNEWLITVFRETNQEKKIQKLLAAFEVNHISSMPLKGFLLKHFYPTVDMRDMCDVDILIKREEYPKIQKIMEENGFTFLKESAHEYIYTNNTSVIVELHKSLVPDYNHDLYAYYGDGWKFARKKEGYEYLHELSREDFYIYIVAHAAKHYLNGGMGIRQVADLWVLNNRFGEEALDFAYIRNELEKLQLNRFYDRICALSKVWFDGQTPGETVKEMEQYILMSGIRGTGERAGLSRIYRGSQEKAYKRVRREGMLKLIVPSLKNLRSRYPILQKAPVLYPVWIVWRWIDILFTRPWKIKKNIKISMSPDDEVQAFADHCEAVGLRKTL